VPAIGYIRVSMMREEAISPETQRASIEAYAARNGRKIIDWVSDLDKTGRNFRRKITAAIARVKAGEADEIVVWKFSRFGRTRHGVAVNLAELEEAGGRLVSATEEVDADTATGRFTRGMLLEIAAFESDRAGESWAEAYSHRVRRGLPPLGRPRFGYRRLGRVPDEDDPHRTRHVAGEEERYVPDPLAGPALRSMYLAYNRGDGHAVIGHQLNADGWRTSYGNPWRPQAVRDVMDSGFAAGFLWLHDPGCRCKNATRCGRRVYVKGAHEPVISGAEWEAYLERRARNFSLPLRERSPAYPVTGLVRCGHCRWAMIPSGYGQGGMTVFTCRRSREYGDCEGKPSLPVTVIIGAVREALGAFAADLDGQARAAMARAGQRHSAQEAITRLEAHLAKSEKDLVKLARQRAADTELPDEVWRQAAAEARAERDQIAAALAEARKRERHAAAELAPVVSGIVDSWDWLPAAALNGSLRELLRRVAVYRTGDRKRDALGHWELMPVRIEIHPSWEPDPWDSRAAKV
jgi:site-specific DNA recombinase